MKYFKNANSDVFAFEADGSQDDFIPENLIPISMAEADALRYAPPIIDPKLVGIEFDGIMCSATAQDQNGLAAVFLAIQLQGENFQPTRFEFDNGSTLIVTLANWQQFAAVWLPFRQSFFAVT